MALDAFLGHLFGSRSCAQTGQRDRNTRPSQPSERFSDSLHVASLAARVDERDPAPVRLITAPPGPIVNRATQSPIPLGLGGSHRPVAGLEWLPTRWVDGPLTSEIVDIENNSPTTSVAIVTNASMTLVTGLRAWLQEGTDVQGEDPLG
jgi:hypothetical protein